MDVKKTPLYDLHLKHNGKMLNFAGWLLPVEFEGITKEHLQVRSFGGLFDVSHMGEFFVKGEQALKTLEHLCSKSVEKLKKNEAQYNLLINKNGGIVDDIIIYCLEEKANYLLCVNAANIEKDWKFISENNCGATVSNESQQWAQIAVQGPKAFALLKLLGIEEAKPFKMQWVSWNNTDLLFASTGYTGEKGGEIFVKTEFAASLWQKLLEWGGALGIKPVGLGARDTLRLEKAYPLYGNELNEQVNPYQARLSWVVSKDKEFLGKTSMLKEKAKGFNKYLVGIQLEDRGIARSSYLVLNQQGEEIGQLSSGTYSPSLSKSIAMGFVKTEYKDPGQEVWVQVRSKKLLAKVVKLPFF
ncbi:MAG: glycine cleavage system aminomethyltransferase GcvT [Bdellovibrionaceae bacterium]|nr:glycine cleavage system aminomethyltransferase GcvT [Pseudobdellovibrionaceae bacterium]